MLASSYAYTFSAPAILKVITGFNNRDLGFLIATMSLLGAPAMILNAMHSDYQQERYFHVAIPFALMATGFLIGGSSVVPWLAVPALAVASLSYFSLQGPLLALATSFLHGKSAAAGIATMNTIGILGGFVGPLAMGRAKDLTGSYQPGLLMLVIPTLVAATMVLMMRMQSRAVRVAWQRK